MKKTSSLIIFIVFLINIVGCAPGVYLIKDGHEKTAISSQIKDTTVVWSFKNAITIGSVDFAMSSGRDFVQSLADEFRANASQEIIKQLNVHDVLLGPTHKINIYPTEASFGRGGGFVLIKVDVVSPSNDNSKIIWQGIFKIYGKFGLDKSILLKLFVDDLIKELISVKLIN